MSDQEDEPLDDRTLSLLALGVRPIEPPPALRGRILGAARRPALSGLPLTAVAAVAVVALLAGVLIGNTLRAGNSVGPPVVHYALSGHGTESTVSAEVTYLYSEKLAVVRFKGLPQLEAGTVYELWLITPANQAQAAGVFTPDVGGSAQVVVNRSLSGYTLMAVTVETGPSGVDKPTQAPEIYGNIS
jgi:anti-sigma-K factor RskA